MDDHLHQHVNELVARIVALEERMSLNVEIQGKKGTRKMQWPHEYPIPREGDIVVLYPEVLGDPPLAAEVLGAVFAATIPDPDRPHMVVWTIQIVVDENSERVAVVPLGALAQA